MLSLHFLVLACGNHAFAQTGKSVKSAAFSIPSIWNTGSDVEEIKNQLTEIAKEILAMDGFIGLSLARAGGRGVTNSRWGKPENFRQII